MAGHCQVSFSSSFATQLSKLMYYHRAKWYRGGEIGLVASGCRMGAPKIRIRNNKEGSGVVSDRSVCILLTLDFLWRNVTAVHTADSAPTLHRSPTDFYERDDGVKSLHLWTTFAVRRFPTCFTRLSNDLLRARVIRPNSDSLFSAAEKLLEKMAPAEGWRCRFMAELCCYVLCPCLVNWQTSSKDSLVFLCTTPGPNPHVFLTGPFNDRTLYESLLQPWYNP